MYIYNTTQKCFPWNYDKEWAIPDVVKLWKLLGNLWRSPHHSCLWVYEVAFCYTLHMAEGLWAHNNRHSFWRPLTWSEVIWRIDSWVNLKNLAKHGPTNCYSLIVTGRDNGQRHDKVIIMWQHAIIYFHLLTCFDTFFFQNGNSRLPSCGWPD